MRRSAFVTLLCVSVVAGCGKDATEVVSVANPHSYQLIPPNTEVSVGQDSTVSLRKLGLVIVRDGTDTVPGVDTLTQPIPRLSYFVGDTKIMVVDQFGIIRGLKGGTTTLIAKGYEDSIQFNVTVRPHAPTLVRFSVLSGPAGGLIPVASRTDTGTLYALPAHLETSRLEGLIRVNNDTVYCNYCAVPASPAPVRTPRVVIFRSLRPEIATISNPGTATLQTSVVGAARITAVDTSSTPVGFVMDIPGDGISDTVYIKFKLRPIDTLRIRPDSGNFPPNTIDQIGTQRRIYPNSDTLQGNVVASTNTNFVAGVDFLARVQTLPVPPATANPTATFIPIRNTGNATVRRPFLPIVTWESADPTYLQINSAAAIIANCAFIGGTCPNTGRTVLNCNSAAGTMPAVFLGAGNYTVPSCVPTKNIPMPGVLCESASSTDLGSTCSIWIRATATDPATNKQLRRLYRVNVRR